MTIDNGPLITRWADPPLPCGVIAGSKAVTLLNPVGWVSNLFGLISRPNDGTIALEETRLGCMSDFLAVHAGRLFPPFAHA